MSTTPHQPTVTFLHQLLLDTGELTGGPLPVFRLMLSDIVTALHRTDWALISTPEDTAGLDALDQITDINSALEDGTHIGDFLRPLDTAARELQDTHTAADCDWNPDCTLGLTLDRLTSLTAAYQQIQADTNTGSSDTVEAAA